MKCAVHTEVDAAGYCRNCGKALCPACARDVQGVLYCETCLANLVSRPAGPAPIAASSPALAAFLGFVPGLGAVYNGQYTKAVVHVMIFAAIVTMDSTGQGQPFWGLMTAAFVFYMAIEAYNTARQRMLAGASAQPPSWGAGKPVGAIILIVLGVLFLLDQRFNIWERIGDYWPVVLIALGVGMLWKQMTSKDDTQSPTRQ